MGEANDVAENGCMRDLLQRFPEGKHLKTEFIVSNEETEDMELNLGLSLGGCFGVNSKEKKLVRSSSIASSTKLLRDDDGYLPRTTSLPVETEEVRRKRKELQSLRRIEAMKKRSEKQRNFRVGKDRVPFGGICEDDKPAEEFLLPMALKRKIESTSSWAFQNGFSPKVESPFRLTNGKGLRGFLNSSQGSIGSRGSSSSGIFEFESRSGQGLSNCTETRSPTSVQSLPEQCEQKPIIAPISTTAEKSETSTAVEAGNPLKKHKVIDNCTRETGMKAMEDMPCVSTRGDGPNGKRIEGFLYQYKKGEEVKIVCVCHGIFFSPAEFVKHAGGGDVAHPLRHIVVSSASSSLL